MRLWLAGSGDRRTLLPRMRWSGLAASGGTSLCARRDHGGERARGAHLVRSVRVGLRDRERCEVSHRSRDGAGGSHGSTPLRAGTATKIVLNMISTGVMVKLGHVYGNLMVNVQPTNAKAAGSGSAQRIIQEIGGSYEPARAAERCLKFRAATCRLAIIMEKKGSRATLPRSFWTRSKAGCEPRCCRNNGSISHSGRRAAQGLHSGEWSEERRASDACRGASHG